MNDQELLRLCSKYLIYDPETGIITNRVTRGPSKIGEISGCLEGLGYRRIRLDHKLYLTHRLAFLIINRYLPKFIDHANGDRGDNRIINLREATSSQNGSNRGMSSNNISGYKGVHWHSRDKKWRAVIKGNCLGLFDCRHEAAAAYDVAVIEYYGEFGKTNKQIKELCK